jgi:hypothetical protein
MSRITKVSATGTVGRWRTRFKRNRLVPVLGLWVAVVAVASLVGVAVDKSKTLGLVAAGLVLGLGILIADPLFIVVLALPGGLLIQRVGGGGTNLSGADLLVFIGAAIALFFVRWDRAPNLRRFMRGIVWFQAVLLLVLIAHPFRDNIIEWFHRWSYLGGSVIVGWVIASYGRTRQALRLYLAGSTLLALIAIENSVTQHFLPAQWGSYQKNGLGVIMLIAVLITQINPPWVGIGRGEARIYKYPCILGLLASQSRQSAILLILGIALAFFLNPELRGRSKLLMVGAIPLIVALYFSFTVNARVNPKFNSVSVRVDQISAAIHVWHLSPLLGEGMRFYNLPQFLYVTAPPNVLIDNLASTGIVGSLAFVFMVVVTLRALYRLPYAIGTLGLVVLLSHYVDGMFDIFWIGASSVTPLIIAGISLGMADLQQTGDGSRLTQRGSDGLADPVASVDRVRTGSSLRSGLASYRIGWRGSDRALPAP